VVTSQRRRVVTRLRQPQAVTVTPQRRTATLLLRYVLLCVLLSLPLPLFVTLNQYGLRRLVVASQTAQHAVSGHGNVAASNDRDDHKVRVVASCVFVALCIRRSARRHSAGARRVMRHCRLRLAQPEAVAVTLRT
jgi:hypothetical protein